MTQNIYDHPDFFAGYSQLPRQQLGLDGAPEWPAIRALLPALRGKRVADLGCGFGWVSRWMRQQGADQVVGIDVSENMIARARADTTDTHIDYRIGNLDSLILPESSVDLIYSALTFHYVRDYERLVRMLYQALQPGGTLVFTIEHPIYMASRGPKWIDHPDGFKTWPVDGYSKEGERRTDWFTSGVLKHHRTLGTTLNGLIQARFRLTAVQEFAPSREQIDAQPALLEELERPMMLLVSCTRPSIDID